MSFEELLKASINGLPEVIANNPKKPGHFSSGKVTVIKDSNGYKGCAVSFPGISYDTWFYADTVADKRCRYMAELKLK